MVMTRRVGHVYLSGTAVVIAIVLQIQPYKQHCTNYVNVEQVLVPLNLSFNEDQALEKFRLDWIFLDVYEQKGQYFNLRADSSQPPRIKTDRVTIRKGALIGSKYTQSKH